MFTRTFMKVGHMAQQLKDTADSTGSHLPTLCLLETNQAKDQT